MKKIFLIASLLFTFQITYAASSKEIDYKKIFVKSENWATSAAFLKWATPLNSHNKQMECSLAVKKRILSNPNKVLKCKQVSTVHSDKNTESALIVWANFKTIKPSVYGHSCNAGLVYLSKTKKIVEDSPADCKYVQDIEDPFSEPILIYKVKNNGAIGIVSYGQGAECGGRSAIEQKDNQFKEVHIFEMNCIQ
jgi:hypothetical protein